MIDYRGDNVERAVYTALLLTLELYLLGFRLPASRSIDAGLDAEKTLHKN